ncbi:MAG: hypothetical protein ACYDCD_12665 [Candidatus Acidiferrales bacterium]
MVTISGIAAAFRGLRHRFMNRLRSRYTRALEDEVARLRAENHALVNSILGVAGIPPIRLVSAGAVAGRGAVRSGGVTPAGAGAARPKTGPTRMPNGSGVGEQKHPVGAGLPRLLRPDDSVGNTRPGEAEASPLHTKIPGSPAPFGKRGFCDLRGTDRTPSVAQASACADAVAPLRKRSWQQIGRVREIEDARAARRERESNTETFPTPSRIVIRGDS